jgi:hypothetical protein
MYSNINYRFKREHCHAANKCSIGAMKTKQIIKECSIQTCKDLYLI